VRMLPNVMQMNGASPLKPNRIVGVGEIILPQYSKACNR
jgi:hypothetical protein